MSSDKPKNQVLTNCYSWSIRVVSILVLMGWIMLPMTLAAKEAPKTCAAFQEDPRVQRHLEVKCSSPTISYWDCEPRGLFKSLYEKCGEYSGIDLMGCKEGKRFVTDDSTQEYAELFADLASDAVDPWIQHCRGGVPKYLWDTGIIGLGMLRTKEKVAPLAGYLENVEALSLSGKQKELMAASLWQTGAKDSQEAMAKALPSGRSEFLFRYHTLRYLSQWKSKAAVSYCVQAVNDADGDTASSCAMYLALVQHKDPKTIKKILRNSGSMGNAGILALGSMGNNAKVKKHLRSIIKNSNSLDSVTARIALINLGDRSHWGKIKKDLRGYYGLLAWLTSPAMRKNAIGFLKQEGRKLKKDNDTLDYATTVAVRAHLGDRGAVKTLVAMLDDPDGSLRDRVVEQVGGGFGYFDVENGPQLVADKRLLPALMEYYENENKERNKKKALTAWLNIQASLAK